MTSRSDDDALSWDGDDDPTLDVGTAASPEPAALAAGAQPPDATDGPQASDAVPAAASVRPMGSAALVATGVAGGIYLLYVIGWVIGGLRLSGVTDFLVSPNGQPPLTWSSGTLVGVWLAAAAPVLWFVTVSLLTREARAWIRWAWLGAGTVLLIPWPLLMMGAGR